MQHEESFVCPICGGDIIEDAWDDVQRQKDGTILMDAYPAYVCEERCGYVQRIKAAPNLFEFATKELSQDAFLCWLFEHILLCLEDAATHIATDLLNDIIEKYITLHPNMEHLRYYELLKVENQKDQIDILLTLKSMNDGKKMFIVIEDKIHSGESRKNQPEYYAEKFLKKHPDAIVIPVLFKTGYVSEVQQKNYKKREIVFVGHEDIYHRFISYLDQLEENVILQSWWQHFHENYYVPIETAKAMGVDPNSNLKQFSRLCKIQGYPSQLAFQIITDHLFGDFKNLHWKRNTVQGKGHVDWHFEIQNPSWKNRQRKIRVNLNFIWDGQDYSFVIKTVPIPYRARRRLDDTEKQAYDHLQASIKSALKELQLKDWKIMNYYLTIGKMQSIQDMPLSQLKNKLEKDIKLISTVFDEIMSDS